jgi:hypothetical protein
MTQLDLFAAPDARTADGPDRPGRARLMKHASGALFIVEPRGDFAYAWAAKPYQDLTSLLREARNAEDGIAGWSPVARIDWPVVELVEVDPAEVTPSTLTLLNYFKERY